MSDSELRAAAEMVVATGTNKDWWDTIDAGALAVCRAWLAEHPADPADTVVLSPEEIERIRQLALEYRWEQFLDHQ